MKKNNVIELPQERLIKNGVDSLSNSELLSIILRTGTREKSVFDLSNEILELTKNFRNLSLCSLNELLSIKGIGIVKACQILSIFEISRRCTLDENIKIKLDTPEKIYEYIIPKLKFKDREHVYVISLNTMLQIISCDLVSIGTVNKADAHPREIFLFAIKNRATSIALIHNHPSGNLYPSKSDEIFTKKLYELSKMMDIVLVDHLIVSDYDYFSMKENQFF